MDEAIRCFLAVEISDEVRQAVAQLTEKLRKGVQFTKARPAWVKPENQHFTVVFLGNRSPEQVEQIKTAMADLPREVALFRVEVGGLGVFPNERSPRVLWVGVREGADAFGSLHEQVVKRLVPVGYEPERRPYHPHLTLARIKSLRGVGEMMNVVHSHRGEQCGAFTASSLTLFRSQLHPAGAIYTPLAHWQFERQA